MCMTDPLRSLRTDWVVLIRPRSDESVLRASVILEREPVLNRSSNDPYVAAAMVV